MCEEKEYLYWLCQIPPLGAVSVVRMWEEFGSFKAVYYIEGRELRERGIIPDSAVKCFDAWKDKFDNCRREYHSLGERGIQFITMLDEAYPRRLREIYSRPVGLYVKGKLPDESRPTAAIVGARNCSNYGEQLAEALASSLAGEGVQVISGLARGIDGAGHRGALKGGGDTYGILGCGINICYPKENYPIYEAMTANGGVISEFGMGEQPSRRNFPMRNRIISGLSDAVIVVEAREKSGSLITVELALEQGKEVFAVPGRVTDPLSAGCNKLIQDGANLLSSPYEILECFGLNREKILRIHEKSQKGLAKKEKKVYSCLDLQPKFIEQIVRETKLSVGDCMSILMELELKGYIIQTASHFYGKKL